jgi:hypothetical protein
MAEVIRGLTPSLKWLNDLLMFFQTEAILIPDKYRDKVIAVKDMLKDDPTGLVNCVLDFAITAALVDYRIECDNEGLSEILEDWLENINEDLRGKVPTGITALAKEYFRERWKGSSHLLLRTFFNEKNGLILPTTMFFVDGEDIVVDSNSEDGVIRLGEETYAIRVAADKSSVERKDDIKLPKLKNEEIFVQRPFESWGILEPIPFIIKRGIYHNSQFMKLMSQKGELIVSKALEYLLIIKKGTERLTLEGNTTYDEEDLKRAKEDLKTMVDKKKQEPGFSSYFTNFDTDISEYIPEYQRAINATIYSPIEKKILAGLGLVDIVESTASTRREAILNPKPFMSEVEQGIMDFKALLKDIIKITIDKNAKAHPKWMKADIDIESSPIKMFMTSDFKSMLRSLYDRGVLSKQTACEIVGELDFDLEVQRRDKETEEELDERMYPPVIQNQEQKDESNDEQTENPEKLTEEETLEDRKGPEAKNFKSASDETEMGKVVKRKNGWHVISEKTGKNLGGPYKTKKEAVTRLRQVEWFKHKGEAEVQ